MVAEAEAYPGFTFCSFSDADDYTIAVHGKRYKFLWSDRFGPVRLNRDGSASERDLPRKVVDAIAQWKQQGKRVEAGLCAWTLTPDRNP